MILILEDNDDRVRQFTEAALELAPPDELRIYRSAHRMIADLPEYLEHATLISLDHDLNEDPNDPADPGTGYDVVQFLAELVPCCPVIIHTSNGERGKWMQGALASARWHSVRIYLTRRRRQLDCDLLVSARQGVD